MRKEKISDALNLIDDQIIEEAQSNRQISKKYKYMSFFRTCVAACLIITISFAIAVELIPKVRHKSNEKTDQNLPILDATMQFDGMGFAGIVAHDISELVNQNPWNEKYEIKTLPVYKNTLDAKEYFDIVADTDKMNSFIVDVAKRFGLKENEIEITTDSRAYTNSLFIKTDNFEIRVDPELTATIELKPSISIPQKYNFSHFANYDDMVSVAKYLKEEYKKVINFNSPIINITGGSYDINNQQSFNIEFFDDSGNITQDIINYNFNRVAFYSKDKNQLYMIRIYQPDLSQKIGDYPIITKKDAIKLLLNGNYATSVPYEMPGKKYISKVELIYCNAYWIDKYYMPYYKFYIELPELEDRHSHKEKTYGIYYVPAVDGQYLENMPVYNGEFN